MRPLQTVRLTVREIIGACLILVTASACKESAWTPRGSAELVLSEIKLGGAANVARRIDADASFGSSVMSGIGSGDSAWLDVAGSLTPASAAAEASLAIALASALPRAPERVLALLGPKYAIEDVCNIPFLEPESTLVTSYHDQAAASLGRVRSPSLQKTRDDCRITLDRARALKLERIDPAYIIKNKPAPAPRGRRR